jgi:hypothetical protein
MSRERDKQNETEGCDAHDDATWDDRTNDATWDDRTNDATWDGTLALLFQRR